MLPGWFQHACKERRFAMGRQFAVLAVLAFALLDAGCSGNMVPTVVAAPSSIKSQLEAGGVVKLPPGTVEMGCSDEAVITKSTKIIGAGRNETILHDTCPSGTATLLVDVTNTITVRIEDLQINHVGGPAIQLTGGVSVPTGAPPEYLPMLDHELSVASVKLTGSTDCLVTEGFNLFLIERSIVKECGHDGARIGSFGVNLHDNWFAHNSHNGVTFIDAGFCGSCTGNEYFLNGAHGLEYASGPGIADPRHIGDFVDSNADVGLVVNGTRDLAFNSGWIGNNQVGGAIVSNAGIIGLTMVGTDFANNFGTNLAVTGNGPQRITANRASLNQYTGCDALI